ncbi:MAG: hypothetical protein H7338_09705 [Candidatus Sericytochromatia bacterium]|nr:hypothetical protein [Candidatus Sericytochromatia bacterium]
MSDVKTTTTGAAPQAGTDRRNQLLQRIQQLSQTSQANAYATVAQMLLGEVDPVRLVSALLSQVAAQQSSTPIAAHGSSGSNGGNRRPRDIARMA